MKRFSVLMGLVLVTFLSVQARPQQATGQTAPPPALDSQADSRLGQVVTLYEPATPLGELLTKISKETGVSLTAERGIANYRAIVVVKEQLLEQVLKKLASAFGFEWRQEAKKDAPPSYVLFQNTRSRYEEQQTVKQVRDLSAQLLRQILSEAQVVRRYQDFETFRKEMEQKSKGLGESSEPMSEKEARQKLLEFAASFLNGWDDWIAAGTLIQLPESAWARLRAGYPITLSSRDPNSPIPPEAMNLWRQQQQQVISAIDKSNLPAVAADSIRRQEEETQSANHLRITFRYDTETGQIRYSMGVGDRPRTDSRSTIVIRTVTTMPNQSSMRFTGALSPADSLNPADWQLSELLYQLSVGSKPSESPDQPSLRKFLGKISFDRGEEGDLFHSWAYRLAKAAKAAEVSLVAEFYPFYPPGDVSHLLRHAIAGQTTRNEILDSGYTLQSENDWVMVRHAQRAFARLYDIPQARIQAWFYKPHAKGQLTLEDCSEIASLSTPQIEALASRLLGSALVFSFDPSAGVQAAGTIRLDRFFVQNAVQAIQNDSTVRYALRLYAQLSSLQRRALLEGKPVLFSTMSGNQQQMFLYLLNLLASQNNIPVAEHPDPNVAAQAALAMTTDVSKGNLVGVLRVMPDSQQPDAPQEGQAQQTFQSNLVRFVLSWAGKELSTGGLMLRTPAETKQDQPSP